MNGRCFFQWPDGATYDGDTLNGKKHGRGVHTWTDGKIYKGQYEGGFEHGFGTLTEADGLCRYRGNFRYGQRHGYGTQIWKEKTYEGEWQYNAVSGKGKLSWKNGAVYNGSFSQGRYHGNGCFVDKSGRKYVGDWVQGSKEGSGRETWMSGMVYVGSYLQGKRHGFGRLTLPDGSIYAGGWIKNKRSGRGIHLKARNGETQHCGMWKNDQPVTATLYAQASVDGPQLPSMDQAESLDAHKQQHNSSHAPEDTISPTPSWVSNNSRRGNQAASSMDDLNLVILRTKATNHPSYQDAEFFWDLQPPSDDEEQPQQQPALDSSLNQSSVDVIALSQ